MTSCFEVEEESNQRHEKFLGEINKTLAALEVIPVRLNWGQIFSLANKTGQHMVIALKHPESNLPMVNTSDGFNLDAYKLMEELGYDFSKPPSVGHAIDAKPYKSNDAQKMVQKRNFDTKDWPWLHAIPASENFKKAV